MMVTCDDNEYKDNYYGIVDDDDDYEDNDAHDVVCTMMITMQ